MKKVYFILGLILIGFAFILWCNHVEGPKDSSIVKIMGRKPILSKRIYEGIDWSDYYVFGKTKDDSFVVYVNGYRNIKGVRGESIEIDKLFDNWSAVDASLGQQMVKTGMVFKVPRERVQVSFFETEDYYLIEEDKW